MIKEMITKEVMNQIRLNNINYRKINVLEKEWGYVVQVDDKRVSTHYNVVFDREGEIIYPLGNFFGDAGSIYNTTIFEGINEKGETERIPDSADVCIRELDEHHFIIPRGHTDLEGGNILFYIDENNNVSYKGFIEGRIDDHLFKPEVSLWEKKLLLCKVTINRIKEEEECFFFSWDLNRRISDKWSSLTSCTSPLEVHAKLWRDFHIEEDLREHIINIMQENDAWLGTLRVNSEDNKKHLNFFSVIGTDGLPLLDLNYTLSDLAIGAFALEKKEIGEVDTKKEYFERCMRQSQLKTEYNKNNQLASFSSVNALGGENRKSLPRKEDPDDGEQINKLIMQKETPFYMS